MNSLRARPTGVECLCAALLLSALAWGGNPAASPVVVQAVGAAALAWGLTRPRSVAPGRGERGLKAILVAAAVVATLQLVPLPPGLWRSLPQRASVWSDLHAAGGLSGWRPMTLDVTGTVRALLALEVFAGMWLLALRLDPPARERLLKLALLAALVLALAGLVQVRDKVDTTGATGTFANRNHFASLMAILVPFAVASAYTARDTVRKAAAWAVTLALLLAAALSFSRAGSVLALAAAVVSALALRSPGRRPRQLLAALLGGTAALTAAGYVAWGRLGERFTSDVFADARWLFATNGLRALQAYFPWGSGLGSFRWVYQGFENPVGLGQYTFATHAHDELLELAIEAGIPGMLVAAAFIAWAISAVAATRSADAGPWRRAAAIASCVVLLHSLVDFPLRTDACSVVLALSFAVLCSPSPARPRR